MLEGLILQAEVALLAKSKQSGKVLQQQDHKEKQYNVEETLQKLTTPRKFVVSPQPSHNTATRRRVSDTSSVTSNTSNTSSTLSSLLSQKPGSTKMTRTLSRQSSPPVMVNIRPYSPPPPLPQPRSASPRYQSQLRNSQEFAADDNKPKWK